MPKGFTQSNYKQNQLKRENKEIKRMNKYLKEIRKIVLNYKSEVVELEKEKEDTTKIFKAGDTSKTNMKK